MERTASCPSCGRGVFQGDAFCSWCGTPIRARSTDTGNERQTLARQTIPTGERENCASCNSPVLPGDVFCSTCGARHGVDPAEGAFTESWTGIPQRVTEASRGKYELVRELGRGGMGVVFMARDRELERLVAIKVLSPTLLADEAMVKRFQREARTIASLRHESIISVYDVGRTGDLHYFVMDFIEGVSLSRILRAFGRLPVPVVQAVFYQVGSALSYAHRPGRGIVHRDVKPSNIMLDAEGLAVVMDFGISKVSEAASGLTKTGLVIGTPEYMSPEQCRGHTVTEASDQYSLGTVVFAMLTGAPPFTGPFYRVLMAHQSEPVPSILEQRPDCPPELARATERMLAKAPGDRWPGIRTALDELGLRPLAHGDPVLRDLAGLVADTMERERKKEADAGGAGAAADSGAHRTPSSIRIVPVPGDLELGDELGLRASALFPDGVEEMGLDVAWESTDPSIVRVDPSTGQLEAVGVGSAVIRASGAGLSESVPVEVKRPEVVRVDIERTEVEVQAGSTVSLRAWPRNKRDEPLERPLTWSSSDPRTASVSTDGVVHGHREGSASILAHCEGVGAAASVRVLAAPAHESAATVPGGSRPVARVDVSDPPRDLRASDTFRLTATPLDDDGRPVEAPVRWTVEHPGIVEDLGEGRFRARRAGQGALLARAGEARTRVHVAVRATSPQPAAGSAPRTPAPEPAVGDRPTSRAGPTASEPDRPAWPVIVGTAVAVVLGLGGLWMGRGFVFGGGGGSGATVAEVTVLDGGQPVPGEMEVALGDSVVLTATPLGADGAALDRPVSWTSSDPAVASVGPGGLVVALAGGSARIRATSDDVEREVTVRVQSPPVEVVLRNAADGTPVAGRVVLRVGQTLDLDAAVLDAAGSPVPGSDVSWSVSPSSVASVGAGGVVSGRAGGQALVTARAGALEAEVSVTVEAVQEQEVDPEPEPPPATPGTLRVTIVPTWAYAIVDGVRRGEGARTHEMSLPAGSHTLRLENPNMMPLDTTFTIGAGGVTELQLRLRERNQG